MGLLCYLLGNLPLTGFLYQEERKLTWTVCGVVFSTWWSQSMCVCLWKWHNVSIWTLYSRRCESLFSIDTLNDCYKSLDHYWGSLLIILYWPADWGSITVHYMRIISRWWYNGFLIHFIFSCVENTLSNVSKTLCVLEFRLPADLNQNAIWNTDQTNIIKVTEKPITKKMVLCEFRRPNVQNHQFTENSLLVRLCEWCCLLQVCQGSDTACHSWPSMQ